MSYRVVSIFHNDALFKYSWSKIINFFFFFFGREKEWGRTSISETESTGRILLWKPSMSLWRIICWRSAFIGQGKELLAFQAGEIMVLLYLPFLSVMVTYFDPSKTPFLFFFFPDQRMFIETLRFTIEHNMYLRFPPFQVPNLSVKVRTVVICICIYV